MAELKPSYKSLFKLMIDKDITKRDLCNKKLVSMEVMMRLCEMLDCNIGEIMSFVEK